MQWSCSNLSGETAKAAVSLPRSTGLSRAQGSRVLTTKGGKESGRRAAPEPGLIPSLLTHWAVRPAAPVRSATEKNMVGLTVSLSRYRQARIPSEPGTHDVRAPEPGLARAGQRAGAYARAAAARGSARGRLGPSGRKRAWERGGARTSQGPKRPVLPAALGSQP